MGIDRTAISSERVAFGPFSLFPARRLIERDGAPLQIGSRALDILLVLVERAGDIVSKSELISRVWSGMTIDESALRVHIAGLRKALREQQDGVQYITNVSGRGYCFVAAIERLKVAGAESASSAGRHLVNTVPSPLKRMIGRDETVRELASLLMTERFVTIVGPGGMGKTSIAIAVAHALREEFCEAIAFVDLVSLVDPDLLVGTVASRLGLRIQTNDPMAALLTFLSDRRLLLILDNCEHLIEATAGLVECIFAGTREAFILTTSREAMRVEGEQVFRLPPLNSPPAKGDRLSAAEIRCFSAVELFVERATASGSRGDLSDAEVTAVACICNRLDGVPLAIELAASCVGIHGIDGTARLLDNRFGLLWHGRRTALPRHQTLNALLDWSYRLLPEGEQIALRRLSVFVGAFTLEAAEVVVTDHAVSVLQLTGALGNLVSKSLVRIDRRGTATLYRLPETTRAYAAAKLAESNEENSIAKAHAAYFMEVLAGRGSGRPHGTDDVPPVSEHLGNMRAALAWCFSPAGDAADGVSLAAVAAPILLDLSLLKECRCLSERALAALDECDRGTERELELQEARAISTMFTLGNSAEVRASIMRGLDLATKLSDRRRQLTLSAGLNIYLSRIGDFQGALAAAHRNAAIARETADPAGLLTADWTLGVTQHLAGQQDAAQRHCEDALLREAGLPNLNTSVFGYDNRVRAIGALARALWLRGFPDRAAAAAKLAVDEADRLDHSVNMCISLIYSSSVFMCRGDWNQAHGFIERLTAHAEAHSLDLYYAVALGLRGELLVRREEPLAGIPLLRTALDRLRSERYITLASSLASALAEGLAKIGQAEEGLGLIEPMILETERQGGSYHMPEMLRLKASLLSALSPVRGDEIDTCLLQSLELARSQSALGWELRAVLMLASRKAEAGYLDEAGRMLSQIYARFTEGFETADLVEARRSLDCLQRVVIDQTAVS